MPASSQVALPSEYRFPLHGAHALVRDGVFVSFGELLVKSPNAVYAPAAGQIRYESDTDTLTLTKPHRATNPVAPLPPWPQWHSKRAAMLIERIDEAGINGLGGGGYPTATKLMLARTNGARAVIGNGVSCEAGITGDRVLLSQQFDAVRSGLRIVAHCLGEREQIQTILAWGIDDDTDRAALPKINGGSTPESAQEILVKPVLREPGAGSERLLVPRLLKQHLDPHQHPTDRGIVCLNVGTLVAIHEAVVLGMPLVRRLVTIGDENLWVYLGHPAAELVDPPLRSGGFWSGTEVPTQAVVNKHTNALWTYQRAAPTPCIECGLCQTHCPVALTPQALLREIEREIGRDLQPVLGERGVFNTQIENELHSCVDCGRCNAVCPANIDLLGAFLNAKQNLTQTEQTKLIAERAKQRYLRHQQRSEQRQQAREQRRQQRLAQGHGPTREW